MSDNPDPSLTVEDLIFDWNGRPPVSQHVEVHDETLRDGLQATYVRHPSLDEKLHLLELMDDLEIDFADVGYPASGDVQAEDVTAIGRAKTRGDIRLDLYCTGRTVREDIEAILRAADASGYPFEAAIFIGSSGIRRLVERWELSEMLDRVQECVRLAVQGGLTAWMVTEDTTRAHPDTIRQLYEAAIAEGATRICVCDTVGYATPSVTRHVVEFVKQEVLRDRPGLDLIWHGHRDRGLGLANCIAALEAGATAIQGTALGVGERAGNVPMEQILAYLWMEGVRTSDIFKLADYAEFASRILNHPISSNQPIVGAEAHNTGSGIHAAAIRKAMEMGRPDLAQSVYNGIHPSVARRTAGAKAGMMGGRSSAALHLLALGIEPTSARIEAVMRAAKRSAHVLADEEIRALAEEPTSPT